MGRLFWKFFFFFVLAQMASIIGVSLFFWISALQQANERHQHERLRSGPIEITLLEAANSALQHGGEPALSALLKQWSSRHMPQVYAVQDNGQDLLSRPLPDDIAQVLDAGRGVMTVPDGHGHVIRLFTLESHRTGFGMGVMPPPQAFGAERLPGSPDVMGPPPGPRGPMFPWTPVWAGLIASLIFAALLAWYVSKPIKELRKAFARVAGGNLEDKVSPAMGKRRDELADLGRSFDRMTTQLHLLMQGQKRLLHYVSHEMRSPLARLQMGIGLAKQSPERRADSLDRIEVESMRMDKLLGEVLELSRLESGVMAVKKENIMLSELLEVAVEDARFEASAKHVTIHSHIEADAEIEAQPDILYRALENVLRNAIKYTPEGSEVSLQTQHRPHWLVVQIADCGAGIPATELDNIFQPFYRTDSAGSVAGHGLGLAITKQVLDLHGGKISLQNRPAGGLLVEVSLPVA